MKIIDIVKMDTAGRVTLDCIGLENWEGVRFSINLEKEMIEITDSKNSSLGRIIIPDQKARVTLPKWVRNELDGNKTLLVLIDEDGSDKIYLSPRTGKVL